MEQRRDKILDLQFFFIFYKIFHFVLLLLIYFLRYKIVVFSYFSFLLIVSLIDLDELKSQP